MALDGNSRLCMAADARQSRPDPQRENGHRLGKDCIPFTARKDRESQEPGELGDPLLYSNLTRPLPTQDHNLLWIQSQSGNETVNDV